MLQHLSELPPSKMVDLAGGEGRNALWFAKRGWQTENVELSQVALDKFLLRAQHENLDGRCTTTHADATTAKFSLSADLLVVAYLQIPAPSLSRALSNAVDQLNPGATVFGVWHAKRNLVDGFGGPPSPEMLPTPKELEAWAKDHLESFEVFEVDRIVEKDGVHHTAIDVILKGQLAKNE